MGLEGRLELEGRPFSSFGEVRAPCVSRGVLGVGGPWVPGVVGPRDLGVVRIRVGLVCLPWGLVAELRALCVNRFEPDFAGLLVSARFVLDVGERGVPKRSNVTKPGIRPVPSSFLCASTLSLVTTGATRADDTDAEADLSPAQVERSLSRGLTESLWAPESGDGNASYNNGGGEGVSC